MSDVARIGQPEIQPLPHWARLAFAARCVRQHPAIIALSQQSQRKVPGPEVIKAGLQIRQVTAHQIQLERVQRTGTRRRPKVHLAPGISLFFRDSSREKENSREVFQSRNFLPAGLYVLLGNGRKG